MQHVQLAEEENPEGWTPEDEAAKKASNPSRANDALANISLDDEADVNILQHQQHRTTQYFALTLLSLCASHALFPRLQSLSDGH